MTKEELITQIFAMSPKERKELERLVEDLRHKKENAKRTHSKRSFRDEPFFGMWKDREDMKEGGAAWIRKLRNGPAWNRLKRDDSR